MSESKVYQDINDKVSKQGDTVSGNLILDTSSESKYLKGSNTAQSVGIMSTSSDTTGASLTLVGGTASSDAGSFKLSAGSGSAEKKSLEGKTDGSLKWNGSTIVTESTGTATKATADASGNVIPDTYLKYNKYYHSGAQSEQVSNIEVNAGDYYTIPYNGRLVLHGGTTSDVEEGGGMFTGARLTLHGKEYLDYTSGEKDNNGAFWLSASDGTNTKSLIGYPDGKLTWKNEELISVPNTAAAHNSVYRGKDLTNVYTLDELSAKLAEGDFTDLYIGDYITKSFTNLSGNTETLDFIFASFDYWYNLGHFGSASRSDYSDYPTNGVTNYHHILIVPKDCFATTAQMNTSNTTENGYYGSAMRTTLKSYATKLNASNCFNGHIKTHMNWLNSKVTTTYYSAAGANFMGSTVWDDTNSKAWTGHKLCLMSEPMVYGGTAFSSSGYDVGCGKTQLPLFSLAPNKILAGLGRNGGRYSWWLSAVSSSANFCGVYADGGASCDAASYSRGVRPFFLFA